MPVPYNDSNQAAHYTDFSQANTYTREEGIAVMGCADGAPVAVRAVKPYGIRNQVWSAEKKNAPPTFPAPWPDTDNSTLISKGYRVPLPTPIQGPNPYWSFAVGGQFIYLERTATDENTGFPTGRHPFEFPALKDAALGSGVGGLPSGPLEFDPSARLIEGAFTWPFTGISKYFADYTLSTTFTVSTSDQILYTLDGLGRG